MTAESPGQDRCPKCGAAVRPGDPWCTLCYADLRPPAPPEPPPVAEPAPAQSPAAYEPAVMPGPDPLTAPLERVTAEIQGPTWPCSTCGTTNAMERDTCADCGAPFLSVLREEHGPLIELPVFGDLMKLGRGQRFAIAFGVVFIIVVLTALLGLIFG